MSFVVSLTGGNRTVFAIGLFTKHLHHRYSKFHPILSSQVYTNNFSNISIRNNSLFVIKQSYFVANYANISHLEHWKVITSITN